MEGGTKYFNGDTPFVMDIKGEVNGKQFRVQGKGTGNAQTGYLKGKWVCTSGKMPISWSAVSASLGYGSKVFVKFPNGITSFYKACFPGGYSQERVFTFDGDGILKGYHEVTLNKGVLYNKVTLHGEGFKQSSPVLNDGLKTMMPTTEYTFPFENGIKSISNQIYPLKIGKGFLVVTQVTINRPLLKAMPAHYKQPGYHHTNLHIKQAKEVDEEADHVIQEELAESYEQCMFGCYDSAHGEHEDC